MEGEWATDGPSKTLDGIRSTDTLNKGNKNSKNRENVKKKDALRVPGQKRENWSGTEAMKKENLERKNNTISCRPKYWKWRNLNAQNVDTSLEWEHWQVNYVYEINMGMFKTQVTMTVFKMTKIMAQQVRVNVGYFCM